VAANHFEPSDGLQNLSQRQGLLIAFPLPSLFGSLSCSSCYDQTEFPRLLKTAKHDASKLASRLAYTVGMNIMGQENIQYLLQTVEAHCHNTGSTLCTSALHLLGILAHQWPALLAPHATELVKVVQDISDDTFLGLMYQILVDTGKHLSKVDKKTKTYMPSAFLSHPRFMSSSCFFCIISAFLSMLRKACSGDSPTLAVSAVQIISNLADKPVEILLPIVKVFVFFLPCLSFFLSYLEFSLTILCGRTPLANSI
jgi:hypothetical protein